jgi:CheY-like chemotaxis protein
MSNKHIILIVDDDLDDREIIRDAFMSSHKKDHEYIFIENGNLLLQYLEDADVSDSLPALIMLDLNMPGTDGRDALKNIKKSERFRQIPTIVFSTSSSQKDMQVSYWLGANCFITKPDTFNKLVELTNSIAQLWLDDKA